MLARPCIGLSLAAVLLGLVWSTTTSSAPACCSVSRQGEIVLNADQSVIMLWDAASQTQHFIRQANFRGESADFGFLVPSPSEPELNESGESAFKTLAAITAPRIIYRQRDRDRGTGGSGGCGCADTKVTTSAKTAEPPTARVLQQKLVAGLDAAVLESDSAEGLVKWLKDHGYAFSPAVQAWAEPYIKAGWKISAFKIAKDQADAPSVETAAQALRMSFKTPKPIFPYREPDNSDAPAALTSKPRLLRIFFLADAVFQGTMDPSLTDPSRVPDPSNIEYWPARTAWAGEIKAESREKILRELKLPTEGIPAKLWLTEFEHQWPYRLTANDVAFRVSGDQQKIERRPTIITVGSWLPQDLTFFALAGAVAIPPLWFRRRRRA